MASQKPSATWRRGASIFLLLFSLISIVVINVGGTGSMGHHTSRIKQYNVSHTIINGGGPIMTYSFKPLKSSSEAYTYHQYLNGLCAISSSTPKSKPICYEPLNHNFHVSALPGAGRSVSDGSYMIHSIPPMHNMAPFVLYIISAICIALAMFYHVCTIERFSWILATPTYIITFSAIGMGILCDLIASIYLTYTALSTKAALLALRSGDGSVIVQKVDLGATFLFLTWAGVGTAIMAFVFVLMDCVSNKKVKESQVEAVAVEVVAVGMTEKETTKAGDEEAPPRYTRDDGLPCYIAV